MTIATAISHCKGMQPFNIVIFRKFVLRKEIESTHIIIIIIIIVFIQSKDKNTYPKLQ